MSHPLPHRPEPLEARIAPAQFFLSGTQLEVRDADGNDVNDATLAPLVGADLAVVLKKGDTLVLDTDGNGVLDDGETVFAKLTAGSAVFFVTDGDMSGSVGADEITGIAAGSGFGATITGDVNGDIATTLAADGTIDPGTILHSSIKGLTITGFVSGNLLAGNSISTVNIGGNTPSALPSVADIRTGTSAANQSISYDGGATPFSTDYTQPTPGAASGSITKVTLAGGATNIRTGAGADSFTGNGGKGGDISAITILDSAGNFIIVPGDGGNSAKVGGKGGNGGSSSKINITSSQTAPDQTQAFIGAGRGGTGDTGGRGGSTSNGTVHFTAATGTYLYIYGRDGGDGGVPGGKNGSGGNGGSLNKYTLMADSTVGFVGFYGGEGGDAGAGSNGKGGGGGSVSNTSYSALGGLYAPDFEAGHGGSGQGKGAGGNGGSLNNIVNDQGDTNFGQQIYGGNGGAAVNGKGGNGGKINNFKHTAGMTAQYVYIHAGGGGTSATGPGGNGGALSKYTLMSGAIGTKIEAFAGNGGTSTAGKGGKGGALNMITATLGDVSGGSALFDAGDGGDGGASGGGVGGAASKVNVTLNGHMASVAAITSGDGGSATAGNGRGGNGGKLSLATLTKNSGAPENINFVAGNGGDGFGTGTGGNGGAASNVTYHGMAPANLLYIGSGNGGDSPGDGARGGNAGNLSTVLLNVPAAGQIDEAAILYGGSGGAAGGEGGKGGNGGKLSGIKLAAPNSIVRINNGPNHGDQHAGDGGTGAGSAGGKGGAVSGVSGNVGLLLVTAQRGGSAEEKGGDGGSVSGVNLGTVAQFVQLIAGGVGGDSSDTGTPGRGGGVSSVKFTGDIGNFGAAFGLDPLAIPGTATPQMGGLVAGLAGSQGSNGIDLTRNGAISGINVTRIAAILAASVVVPGGTFDGTQPNGLSNLNAVSKLTKIKADVLGANAVGGAAFDFTDNMVTNNGMFILGDSDTALDGLVIVLGTTTVLPVTPLRFEQVVPVI